VFKKLVPLMGLMLLAGPVLVLAAPGSTSNTSSTAQTTKSKTHKHTHSHHKKTSSSKPSQT